VRVRSRQTTQVRALAEADARHEERHRLSGLIAASLAGCRCRRLRGRPTLRLRRVERFDADVLVVHGAARIVRLQCDRSRTEPPARTLPSAVPIGGLRPLHELFVVDAHGDHVTLGDYVFREPFVVFRGRLEDVRHVIEASTLHRILVGVVHLNLESL
jgi:hypothetical protein